MSHTIVYRADVVSRNPNTTTILLSRQIFQINEKKCVFLLSPTFPHETICNKVL